MLCETIWEERNILETLQWLKDWQDDQAYLHREYSLAVNPSLLYSHLGMEQFLPWGLWLLTEFISDFAAFPLHSADLALLLHFTLIVIADSCLDGKLPKGQVSQRDIITQVGKYLRALFNDAILFLQHGEVFQSHSISSWP